MKEGPNHLSQIKWEFRGLISSNKLPRFGSYVVRRRLEPRQLARLSRLLDNLIAAPNRVDCALRSRATEAIGRVLKRSVSRRLVAQSSANPYGSKASD